MLRKTPGEPECIGYGTFLDLLNKNPDPLIEAVRQDVRELGDHSRDARPRLVALQNALIDLLEFLDPEHIRFRSESRTKVVS